MHWHMRFNDGGTFETLITARELASALESAELYLKGDWPAGTDAVGNAVTFEACDDDCPDSR